MAKLVDILALELKVWPEAYDSLQQSFGGMVVRRAKDGILPVAHLSVAEDFRTAAVTRAQWQAAVDALKAGDTSYSAENVSVNTNYVSHTSSPDDAECKIIRSEWNGEGLPPTGVEFEWRYGDHAWKIGVALYIGSVYVIFKARDDEQHYYLRDMQFRPIRTPEQIAKEERTKACDKMYGVILDKIPQDRRNNGSDICEALYDAGYRKQK